MPFKDPAKRLEAYRNWHVNNRVHVQELKSVYYQKHKNRIDKRMAKRRQTIRGIAKIILATAVKRHKVIKPLNCEDCGHCVEKSKLHRHHEDYSKPLEVRWLCPICHGKRHRYESR